MKKLALLALTGLDLVSAALPFPTALPLPAVDLNNQADCNRNHQSCREYVLNVDAPWYKVMILLTACDIAFGKCMLSI
jgi:hypothetical protein